MSAAANRIVPRIRTAVVWCAVVAAGLAVRSEQAAGWPDVVTKAAGDALWTTGVFLALRFLLVRVPAASLALAAFVVSGAVEVSQLYRADWIELLRGTWLGGIALGHGFHALDFAWYALGALLGAGLSHCARLETG